MKLALFLGGSLAALLTFQFRVMPGEGGAGLSEGCVYTTLQVMDSRYDPAGVVQAQFRRSEADAWSTTTTLNGVAHFELPPGVHEMHLREAAVDGGLLLGRSTVVDIPWASGDFDSREYDLTITQAKAFPFTLHGPEPGESNAWFEELVCTTPYWTWVTLQGFDQRVQMNCATLIEHEMIQGVLNYYGVTNVDSGYVRAVAFNTRGAQDLSAPLMLQMELADTAAASQASYDVFYIGGEDVVAVAQQINMQPLLNDGGFGFLSIGERLPQGFYVVAAKSASAAQTLQVIPVERDAPDFIDPNVRVAYADNPAATEVLAGAIETANTGAAVSSGFGDGDPEGAVECLALPPGPIPNYSCLNPGLGSLQSIAAFFRSCPTNYIGMTGCNHSDKAVSPRRCGAEGESVESHKTVEKKVETTVHVKNEDGGGSVTASATFSSTEIEAKTFGNGLHGKGQCKRTWARLYVCVHKYESYRDRYRAEYIGGIHIGDKVVEDCVYPYPIYVKCTEESILFGTCSMTCPSEE